MAKVMTAKVKLQCPGGQATPAPPVGPALGQHGVNIGQFVMQFNERTKEMKGTIIPVEITIYSDRTFEFITKSPPAAVLLKQAAGIATGSPEPNKTKVGSVTAEQVQKIAETKLADLNARGLLEEHRGRRALGDELERPVGIDGDLDRDGRPLHFLGPFVELHHELTDIHAMLPQGRSHRGGRRRLPAGALELHLRRHNLGHRVLSLRL